MPAVDQPTKWIRDSGTVLVPSTDLLVDESGNFFVDENSNNLQDSQSSDGPDVKTTWSDTA